MIIKSDKSNTIMVLLLLIIIVFLFLVIYKEHQSLTGASIVCIMPSFLVIRYWVATGRTIILSESGYTICFLWYKKKYFWDELKIKRFGNYKGCFGYRSPYLGGAEFSANLIRKPVWLMPTEYSVLAHPLSYVFVYFCPEKLSKIDAKYPMIYTVDEVVFRDKLKEWGIELQAAKT